MSRRGRIVGISTGSLLGLAAALYLVGVLLTGDRVDRDVTVSGVSIGGLSREEAVQRLRRELGPRAADPIAVTVLGTSTTVDPHQAGLAVDYDRTVDRAGVGRSADPGRIWRLLTGGHPVDPVISADPRRLATAVAGLAADHDREPRNATVRIDGTRIRSRPMLTGLAVRRDAAARVITGALLAEEPVTIPAQRRQPEITDDEIDQLITDQLRPALSGPVRVVVAGRPEAGQATIGSAVIGDALTVRNDAGRPVAALDARRLRRHADAALGDLALDAPKDATITISRGRPVVRPGRAGEAISPGRLAEAVDEVLSGTGSSRRLATVRPTITRPAFDTADAERLGVREVTGEFTTYFPYAEYRNVNISRAAELINGTLLKPAEIFSLNRVVGERSRENGFTEGNVISGGRFMAELGGGVSQSATTTFNAMFFAGLEDVEHHPHSLYISRYPAGREATVAWPTLDLRFRNNTRYGVLVQAGVRKATPDRRGSITVRMWSTPVYDRVIATDPVRSDFTTGGEVTDDSSSCVPTEPVPGFRVSYSRLFYRDGRQVGKQDFSWTYAPTDRRTCV